MRRKKPKKSGKKSLKKKKKGADGSSQRNERRKVAREYDGKEKNNKKNPGWWGGGGGVGFRGVWRNPGMKILILGRKLTRGDTKNHDCRKQQHNSKVVGGEYENRERRTVMGKGRGLFRETKNPVSRNPRAPRGIGSRKPCTCWVHAALRVRCRHEAPSRGGHLVRILAMDRHSCSALSEKLLTALGRRSPVTGRHFGREGSYVLESIRTNISSAGSSSPTARASIQEKAANARLKVRRAIHPKRNNPQGKRRHRARQGKASKRRF